MPSYETEKQMLLDANNFCDEINLLLSQKKAAGPESKDVILTLQILSKIKALNTLIESNESVFNNYLQEGNLKRQAQNNFLLSKNLPTILPVISHINATLRTVNDNTLVSNLEMEALSAQRPREIVNFLTDYHMVSKELTQEIKSAESGSPVYEGRAVETLHKAKALLEHGKSEILPLHYQKKDHVSFEAKLMLLESRITKLEGYTKDNSYGHLRG